MKKKIANDLTLSPYLLAVLERQQINTTAELRAKVRHKKQADLELFLAPAYLANNRSLRDVTHYVGFLVDIGLTANEIHGMFVDAQRIGWIKVLNQTR